MLNEQFLIQLFLYFAKFARREGIEPLFNNAGSKADGYQELKQMIIELEPHSLTNIKNYIFGANLQAITQRVNNIATGDDYLFVDFGEINCTTDRTNVMTDEAELAITVAYRLKSFSADLIEQTLAFNHSLQKLVKIRNAMYQDQQCTPWLKTLSNNHRMVPFSSPEMSSVGWSLIFTRTGKDSFGAKANQV